MSHKQSVFTIISGIFFLLVALNSCNKNEELGVNVLPPEDLLNVGYTISIPVTAYTVKDDSIRTDKTLYNLTGSFYDPVFGQTTAGTYTQFRLSTNDVNFGTNPVCDSIVLSLTYYSYYGDTNTSLTLNVFEIAEDFYADTTYYAYDELGVYKQNLANFTFFPRPSDSVTLDSTSYAPHLRVKLKKTLGQKFINASGSSYLANNENFLQFFKGLYYTVNKVSSGGIMLYFNLTAALSKLTLYYHNDSDTNEYDFVINSSCARFNTFNHYNFSQAASSLHNQLNGDTTLGDNLVYVQPMAGTRVHIKFPEALTLNNLGKIAINKAELVVNIDETNITDYPPPDKLTLIKINSDGTYSFLPDYYYGDPYFGGSYNETKKEYRFNISTYLQQALINGSFNDRGLFMTVSGASIKANRAVIFGNKNTAGNLRLEIIYTKIN